MKKLYFFCIALVALMLASCGGKDYREMLPADSFVIVSINPESLSRKSQVGDFTQSVYYKMAERRAKRIYAVYCKDPDWFMLNTNHIVPWVNKFFLKPEEKLTLSHIEFACLPKCYAGLGITTGIQLYTWAQKNQNPPK